jgi:ribosomal protein L34E
MVLDKSIELWYNSSFSMEIVMANQFKPRFYSPEQGLISCGKCNTNKTLDQFHKDSSNKYGVAYFCKDCATSISRKLHQKRCNDIEYKTAKRSSYTKTKFGLTLEEYTKKLKAQDCKCAICGLELPTSGHLTHLDHCHATGKIRAFLCTNCNRGLGHFQDSVSNLTEAITYLKTHNSSAD